MTQIKLYFGGGLDLSIFGYMCMRCGKKLKKGDEVIKISEFQLYHSVCYKRNREEAYENIGKSDQQFLREVSLNMDSFKTLVDSESISDSKSFYRIWGKQLSNIHLLSAVMADAEWFGSMGFIEKIRLKRRLNQQRNTLTEIGNFYREVYGALQIERHMKELYPSSGEPTLEKLKNEEMEALEMLRKQIFDVCNDLETLSRDVKKVSRKTALKIRERMKRQIQEIPKLIEIL